MNRIVIAFGREDSVTRIAKMLESGGIPVRYRCRSGGEVIRAVKNMDGGIIICGYKLTDMTYAELFACLGDMAMMLLIASPNQLRLCDNDEIFELAAPINGSLLCGSVRMLMQMEEKKLKKLIPQRTASENEIIKKAKALLMEKNRLTEEQAHKFIQKKSMETSTKMVETALLLLRAYDS